MNEVTRETVNVRKHEPPKFTIILHTKLLTYSIISPQRKLTDLYLLRIPPHNTHTTSLEVTEILSSYITAREDIK